MGQSSRRGDSEIRGKLNPFARRRSSEWVAVARGQGRRYAFTVSPKAATEMQIERYRQMTCEERLGIDFRLHELSCELARIGIRRQRPDASEEEVDWRLRARLELARTR